MDVLRIKQYIMVCVICDDKLDKDSETFCSYHLMESDLYEKEKSSPRK